MPTIYPWNIFSRVPCVEAISPGWGKIKGGPEHLLTEDGYLSASQARNKFMSEVENFLNRKACLNFDGEAVRMSSSRQGPAVAMKVYWKQITLDIDLVPCVKSDDISNSNDADMVAKPKDGMTGWRKSYTRHEKEKSVYLNRWCRFRDMVKMIQKALQDCSFPNYFRSDENILSEYSQDSLQKAAGYLAQIIEKDEYYTLLECCVKSSIKECCESPKDVGKT